MLLLAPLTADAAVTDSLGRSWDAKLHPRGRDGKFIHTFKRVSAFLHDGDSDPWMTGEVTQINPDGSIRVRVTHTVDPNLKDPSTGLPYVGHEVDVQSGSVESINEKAVLDGAPGAPSATGATDAISKYAFNEQGLRDFAKRVGLSDVVTNELVERTLDYQNGKNKVFFTDRPRYYAALYAKSISGDGREHSDQDFRDLLGEMGVDPNVTDDTPDGMSGLKVLADKVNATHSPSFSNMDDPTWYNDVPPIHEGSVREAQLRDSDVRIGWFDDGTTGFINPDGSVDKYDANEVGKSIYAAGHDRDKGVDPKASIAPAPQANLNKPPEPDEMDTPLDFGDPAPAPAPEPNPTPPPEPTEAPAASSNFDTADLRDLGENLGNSNSEFADDYAQSLYQIAESLDDGKISNQEAVAQLKGIDNDLYYESFDLEDADDPNGAQKLNELRGSIKDEIAKLSADTGSNAPSTPPADESNVTDAAPAVADVQPSNPYADSSHRSSNVYTEGQILAIDEYQADSQAVNDGLRNKDVSEDAQQIIDAMDDAFGQDTLKLDTELYRGVRFDQDDEMLQKLQTPGAIIGDKGYVSTSRNQGAAEKFTKSNVSENKTPVMMTIEAADGTPIIDFGKMYDDGDDMDESEVLFQRGSGLQVVSSSGPDDNGVIQVHARVVAPGDVPDDAPEVDAGEVDEPTATGTPDTSEVPPVVAEQTGPGPESDDWQNMTDDLGAYRYDSSGTRVRPGDIVTSTTDGQAYTVKSFERNNQGIIIVDSNGKKRARYRTKLTKSNAAVEESLTPLAPQPVVPTPTTDPAAPAQDSRPGPDSDDWQNMVDDVGVYRYNGDGIKLRIGDEVASTTDGQTYRIKNFERNNQGVIIVGADGKKRARYRTKLNKTS